VPGRPSLFFTAVVSFFLFLSAAAGQTSALSIQVQLPASLVDAPDNSTITMPANAVGQPVAGAVNVINRSSATQQINVIQITGSSDFTLSNLPALPFVLTPGANFGFQISYAATTSARTTARLSIIFSSSPTSTASTTIGVNFAGTAPEFVASYTPQGGNATPIVNNGTIRFPATATDTTSTATVVLTNRGTNEGRIQAVAVNGENFQLAGLPLPGTIVAAGAEVRFSVIFTPKQLDPARGTLTVATSDRSVAFNLEGSGTGAVFAYALTQDGSSAPIAPNQTIRLPEAKVGEKSTIPIAVCNNGNAEGRITAISVSGAGFTTEQVPLLPLTLPVGGCAALQIVFTPTVPGQAAGRLRIGNDDFTVAANALGATFNFAYVIGGQSTQVASGGSVNFTPVAVGASSSLRFLISNTGTAATTVNSIGMAAPSTVFTLGTLPALPATIEPGGSLGLDITFAPSALGTATATLRIDNQTFTLSGAGNAPPPLPAIRFDGATGAQEALQQPAVGVTIASAYPLAVNGTLTLAFNSDVFSNDPAVQFATGGRTVNFTIPANTTRAIFANGANQIRIQTGSVAGTIMLTPAVSTDSGINLTPTTPPSHVLTVAQGAPRILSAIVSAKTANSITLLVSGYATSRSVTQMDLTFTPVSGENVGTTRLTLNVEPAFIGWFSGTGSAPFGSLFTMTVPLSFTGDVTDVTNVSDTVQSVSITLANRTGTSAATSVSLRQ
jgi:hypothetical protein